MRVPAVVALVLVLAGCAPAPAGVVSDPRPVEIVGSGRPSAGAIGVPSIAWSGVGRLVLVTRGSGSCPDVPESSAVADGALTLRMREYSGACTADLAPYRMEFAAPEGVDPARRTTVRLHHDRTKDVVLHLAPAA